MSADASSAAFAPQTLLALTARGNGPAARTANESCGPATAFSARLPNVVFQFDAMQ